MNLAQMQAASVQEIALEAERVLSLLARRIDVELHRRNADRFQSNKAEKTLARWSQSARNAEIECGIIGTDYDLVLKEADDACI